MGIKTMREKGDPEAVPFFKRAIELDPSFALGYVSLGICYSNLGQASLAAENIKKANQVAQLWTQSYPRDASARGNLGNTYMTLGQWDKALVEANQALDLDPDAIVTYGNLGLIYLALNRTDDAGAALKRARTRKLDGEWLHQVAYEMSFLRNDLAGMERHVAWAIGRPGDEDFLLSVQSDTRPMMAD